jgi:hypothetical protein
MQSSVTAPTSTTHNSSVREALTRAAPNRAHAQVLYQGKVLTRKQTFTPTSALNCSVFMATEEAIWKITATTQS